MSSDAEVQLQDWLAVVAHDEEAPPDPVEAAAKRACKALLGAEQTASRPGCSSLVTTEGVVRRASVRITTVVELLEALAAPRAAVFNGMDCDAAIAALRSDDPWLEANCISLGLLAAGAAGELAAWWDAVGPVAGQVVARLARRDPVAALGLWAHLVPAWRETPEPRPVIAATESFLVAQQHPDGLAYPVGGGGACPDFNWLSVVLACCEREIVSERRMRPRIERMVEALARNLDNVPVCESFRPGPLPPWRRWGQPSSVRRWTRRSAFRRYRLCNGDWFSTLLRVTTVLSAAAALRGATLDRDRAFHYLGCWIPSA